MLSKFMSFTGTCLLVFAFAGSVGANTIGFVTVTAMTNPYGTISVSPSATLYPVGTKVQIKATPKSSAKFYGWTFGKKSLLATDSLLLDSNKTISALFADTTEYVPYGGFEFDFKKWIVARNASDTTKVFIRNGMLCVDQRLMYTKTHNTQLLYDLPPLKAGVAYNLTFIGKVLDSNRFMVLLRKATSPWNQISTLAQKGTVDATHSRFAFTLIPSVTTDSARLTFDLGLDSSEICLDSISLRAPTTTTFAGRSLAAAGLLSRERLAIQTLEPGTWTLMRLDGQILRTGRFLRAGSNFVENIPAGVAILTIQTKSERINIPITNFR